MNTMVPNKGASESVLDALLAILVMVLIISGMCFGGYMVIVISNWIVSDDNVIDLLEGYTLIEAEFWLSVSVVWIYFWIRYLHFNLSVIPSIILTVALVSFTSAVSVGSYVMFQNTMEIDQLNFAYKGLESENEALRERISTIEKAIFAGDFGSELIEQCKKYLSSKLAKKGKRRSSAIIEELCESLVYDHKMKLL